MLREKAEHIMDKAKNSESHSEKLPEIIKYFSEIKESFSKYFLHFLTIKLVVPIRR